MKLLKDMSEKGLDTSLNTIEKISIRGVIKIGDLFLMQEAKDGELKLAGGMIEYGESHKETLDRELKEELGCDLIKIIKELGYMVENRRDVFNEKQNYKRITYFYLCEIVENNHPLNLTESEKQRGFVPSKVSLERAICQNLKLLKNPYQQRDTEFLKMIYNNEIEI